MGVSVLFYRVVELAAHVHGGPLNTLPGIWTGVAGEYAIKLNPHRTPDGDLQPFTALITRGDWPVAVLDPGGGTVLAHGDIGEAEAEIIAAVEAEMRARGGTPQAARS